MRLNLRLLWIAALTLWLGFPGASMAQGQDVTVRGGVHPSYTRLVFDWDNAPNYSVTKTDHGLRITFTTPGQIDLENMGDADLPNIRDIAVDDQSSNGSTVSFSIPQGSKHRDFVAGSRVIIDVYNPEGQPSFVAKEESKPKPPQPAQEQKIAQVDPEPPAAKEPEETTTEPEEEIERQVLAPPEVGPHKIQLNTSRAFNVAVFLRGDWLWLVHDDPDMGVSPVLGGDKVEKFGEFERFDINGGMAYRLKMPEGFYAYGDQGGAVWQITVTPDKPDIQPTELVREYNDKDTVRGGNLVWPVLQTGSVLKVKDPAVGDTVTVVTVALPKTSGGEAREFTELSILDSPIGLALVPKVDDLEVSRLSQQIIITRPEGLVLARPKDFKSLQMGEQVSEQAKKLDPMKRIYNFPAWEMGGVKELKNNQTLLMSDMANKDPKDKVTDLMTLAKINVTNMMGAEALGFLEIAEETLPKVVYDKEFLALRGAANILANRHEEALSDFSRPPLEDMDEVGYWKAVALANLQDWQQAYDVMPKRFKVLEDYPARMHHPVALTMAEVALRAADTKIAEQLMGPIAEDLEEAQTPQGAEWRYLMGELERQRGNADAATQYWEGLLKGNDDLHRVKAGLALTRLQKEQETIKPEEVIDRLESLRYAWRGDELETLVNYRLSRAYLDQSDYLKGLTLLRNTASLMPGSKIAQQVTAELTQIFHDIFVEDKIKDIEPLEAITLYEEFKELTPPGEEGDYVARKLADRLVRADLLDRAVEILDNQVKRRLSGEKKVDVALRLAGIQLLDGQAQAALEILDLAEDEIKNMEDTSGTDFMSKYNVEMSLLRATALAKLDKTGPALAVLKKLPPERDVLRLRIDLSWRDARWEDAAESLQDLIYLEDISLNKSISEDQAALILNRAIALNLSGNRVALSSLRSRYGSLMERTSKAKLFDVVTRERQSRLTGSREALGDLIGEVDLFGGFLDSYKELN